MISKKLLSDVLGVTILYMSDEYDNNLVPYEVPIDGWCTINIYELAHKCKRWVISNDICISSGNGLLKDDGFYCSIDGFMPTEEKIFYADTEVEAIFKATQWVYDNKKGN